MIMPRPSLPAKISARLFGYDSSRSTRIRKPSASRISKLFSAVHEGIKLVLWSFLDHHVLSEENLHHGISQAISVALFLIDKDSRGQKAKDGALRRGATKRWS